MVKKVIFDVDGTLLSRDEKLRPGCLSVFKALRRAGIMVGLWSGRGVGYCDGWSGFIDPAGEVDIKIFHKHTMFLDSSFAVVDDDASVIEVVKCFEAQAFLVPYYDSGAVPEDDELYRVLDKILNG